MDDIKYLSKFIKFDGDIHGSMAALPILHYFCLKLEPTFYVCNIENKIINYLLFLLKKLTY